VRPPSRVEHSPVARSDGRPICWCGSKLRTNANKCSVLFQLWLFNGVHVCVGLGVWCGVWCQPSWRALHTTATLYGSMSCLCPAPARGGLAVRMALQWAKYVAIRSAFYISTPCSLHFTRVVCTPAADLKAMSEFVLRGCAYVSVCICGLWCCLGRCRSAMRR
jgi:hypothetical protein